MNREKYIGIQTELKKRKSLLACMGDYACLFLCLCSIADEYFEAKGDKKEIDLVEFALKCREKGFISDDWICRTELILNFATGAEWKKKVLKTLPESIPNSMFTVEKWYNKRTGYTHFRRRWGDTLKSSITVKEGILQEYYIFTVQDS